MKTDSTYKRAFNDALDLMKTMRADDELPSENNLSSTLLVSRTTVRKILTAFEEKGLIRHKGRARFRSAARVIEPKFPVRETMSASAQVETQFLEWMLHDDAKPGTAINELDLARRFGVATNVIREFLIRFQRFGLIEKRVGSGWVFKGFTQNFAKELFEIREMFEMRSAREFCRLPANSPLWAHLEVLRLRHLEILGEIDTKFHAFSELDSAFHRLLNSAVPNRFIDSFYDIITMIFHYHYQWNKQDERQRNEVAAREHLAYIEALQSRDARKAEKACAAHLTSARATLKRSVMRQ